MLKILVCGSRDWVDRDAIERRLGLVPYVRPDVPLVIHGGAPGADFIAGNVARELGMQVHTEKADWSRGKRGGPERNRRMLDMEPHVVIAFQRNGSRGTQDTIDEARRRGIKVEVYADSPASPRKDQTND